MELPYFNSATVSFINWSLKDKTQQCHGFFFKLEFSLQKIVKFFYLLKILETQTRKLPAIPYFMEKPLPFFSMHNYT